MKIKVHYAFSLFCVAALILIYHKVTGHPISRQIINFAARTSTEFNARTIIEMGPLTIATAILVGSLPGSDLFTLDMKMKNRPNKFAFVIITSIILLAIIYIIGTTYTIPFLLKANYLLPFVIGIFLGFITQTIGVLVYKIQNNRLFGTTFWSIMAFVFVILVYLTIEG